jgi:hypothetical protein
VLQYASSVRLVFEYPGSANVHVRLSAAKVRSGNFALKTTHTPSGVVMFVIPESGPRFKEEYSIAPARADSTPQTP